MAGSRKQVLVTGAAGFLGSHLCEYLVDRGDEVVGIDNLSTGSEDNLTTLRRRMHDNDLPGSFGFLKMDVRERVDLASIDVIYHLACPASPKAYQADPIGTTLTAVVGTRNMLALALRRNARIVIASTSEVYGSPAVHPQTEEYWGCVNPCGVRSCYDEGKRCAESLAMDYHRQHETNIGIARLFNSYGPRLAKDDGRVVSNFIVQSLCGEPLTIYGDGRQTRSLCYVSDTIAGLVALGDSDFPGPVNIGNPNEITMRELSDMVNRMTGNKTACRFESLPHDDPPRRCPDISLARDVLNWSPSVSTRAGLQKTIDYFRTVLHMENDE